ncbi:hypothetical protein PF003_g14167 [Phytophthora fragariae]|nr:hypothetical protein PF003_g14167 [Phytophthora fragariae]
MRMTSGADAADGNPDGVMNEVEGCVATTDSTVDVASTPEADLVAAPVCDCEVTTVDTDGSVARSLVVVWRRHLITAGVLRMFDAR